MIARFLVILCKSDEEALYLDWEKPDNTKAFITMLGKNNEIR